MKKAIDSFLRIIVSRTALNIYFWTVLLIIKIPDINDQHAYSNAFYIGMMLFYMSFFVILSYVNNLVLLPKLLFRQKQLLYTATTLSVVFIIAYIYTFLMKWIPMVLPGFSAMDVSIIMSPVTNDLSFWGVINDISTYFWMMVIWTTLFTLLGYYHHSIQKNQLLESQIRKHRETELAFIKDQMNPHFLFNTLNNLYGLAIKKSDDTPEVILKLSSILRYMLYESSPQTVSFNKEKEVIQSYIDIELLRLPQNPNINFSITADQPYQVPPLLWLAPLENVFKHSRSVDSLEVDFSLQLINNQFHLYCRNNFKPITNSSTAGGLGLSNLSKRLEWLFPGRYEMTTHIDENYFIIDLKLKLN